MSTEYTGRQIVMETFVNEGVDFIVGNPGTTELPLIDILPDYPSIEYILTLQEAVAVSIADAYAQLSGKVGVANLHVGPGLGNAMGSIYNAWEGGSPLLVTAGQQDTRYRLREPVLWHDLVRMAEPVTKWSVQAEHVAELPELLHRAFKVALDPPSGPVFVALPMNVMIDSTEHAPRQPSHLFRRTPADPAGITQAVSLIKDAKRPVIFCGDKVSKAGAVDELVALAEALGAPVYGDILPAHLSFPNQHPCFRNRGFGDHAQLRAIVGDADLVLLVAGEFFEEVWYTDVEPFGDDTAVIQLDAAPGNLGRNYRLDCGLLGDPKLVLRDLLSAIDGSLDDAYRDGARSRFAALETAKSTERSKQAARVAKSAANKPMSSAVFVSELAKALPPNVALAREAITTDNDINRSLGFESPGDYLGSRGGGIGQGLPSAIGMKLAYPDRPVLCLSGDGSSLYTIQALWTAAHHKLPIVFVILNNRVYRVLKYNMNRFRAVAGVEEHKGYPHLDLTDPDIDFVSVAEGFGLAAERVVEESEVGPAVQRAFAAGRPYLLDVQIDGSV